MVDSLSSPAIARPASIPVTDCVSRQTNVSAAGDAETAWFLPLNHGSQVPIVAHIDGKLVGQTPEDFAKRVLSNIAV